MSKKKIYILSGAGLSAESGIKTFRDNDGLWENYSVEEVCSVQGWQRDRQKVSDFYDARRADIEHKEPNRAHIELAKLKARHSDNIVMLTQNVDNMLEKAGCDEVIHLHGTLTDLRCESCEEVFFVGYSAQKGKTCPACTSDDVRHNVVMFGEAAPAYEHLRELYHHADMVIVIGTSGQVIDTAYIAQNVENSVILNLDVDEYIDRHFKTRIYNKATVGIDKVVDIVEEFLEM
ncbi:MAG: NAD-dependent protein deacetylase of SIR2 family [uncultured Sulfurovum sp.]|uniref:protein acetyllysine N-acetyltransferase n=1 Tax=uncultured Sulfurovum sp. TaxID=269237 RepID=A0A6S6S734_9BACT|nr:MAG: NAD-dependent protein deacetylase of SIR2 family [uncultured Sulfurovum sp.]